RWFYRRRGAALSLSTAGASAGSLVMAPFATYLILLAGWQVSWFVLGTLVILLALPLALIIIKDDPEEIGEIPDGDPNPVKGVKRTRQVEARGPLEAARWKDSYKSLPMWQLTGAYFVCGMTTAIISAHYVPFAIDRGASPGAAALAFGLMSGLNVLGVLGAGALSDRFGRKNVLGATYAVRGLAYAMLLLAPGALGLWGFAVVAGVSWIASAPLTSSLTAEIYGLKNMGTLNGMVTFAHQMGGALSIYMGGLLYDVFGAYNVPFAIAGFMLVGASLSAFAIRERRYSSRYQPLLPQPAAVPAGDAN
ncbi:MAG: MFS transporter, partial [Chloroflexi bacterium]|nr:MFS transporter [Chloroflexota bacterium]